VRLRTLWLAFVISMATVARATDPVRVIVHPATNALTLERDQVSRMFLRKESYWPDGTEVAPVDQRTASEVRLRFTGWVHRRSVSAIAYYWQQRVFSGHGAPPPERSSDREVIEFVAETPGAIGYVSTAADIRRVQEVKIVDE
jgi:ABC-type phosphate transport system substrate-binding protein